MTCITWQKKGETKSEQSFDPRLDDDTSRDFDPPDGHRYESIAWRDICSSVCLKTRPRRPDVGPYRLVDDE